VRPIYRTGVPLPSRCYISYIFFSTNISTEYFKHAAHSPYFSSKCRLFDNANFFWFLCYLHFTYRMCYNLNVKLRCQEVNLHVDITIGFSVCCEDGRTWSLQSPNKNNSPAVRRSTTTTFSELPVNILSGVTLLSLMYLQR
jgi:hypothetical protein